MRHASGSSSLTVGEGRITDFSGAPNSKLLLTNLVFEVAFWWPTFVQASVFGNNNVSHPCPGLWFYEIMTSHNSFDLLRFVKYCGQLALAFFPKRACGLLRSFGFPRFFGRHVDVPRRRKILKSCCVIVVRDGWLWRSTTRLKQITTPEHQK